MKKLISLSVFIYAISFQAQTTKIETGIYKGSAQGQDIMLKLNDDKTFEMTFFYGTYTIENDSLRFNSNAKDNSKFKVKPIADADFSSTLKLRFDIAVEGYYLSSLYIGTQKNQNTQITYQRLTDLIDLESYDTQPENLTVDVPKCQFLYLATIDYDQKTSVSKYEVEDTVNALALEYNPYNISDIKLMGYIDGESKKLAITDAKKAVFFTIEKDNALPNDEKILNALSVTEEKDWAKNNGFESDYDYVDTYTENTYDFKHVIDNSFDAALKAITKSPAKFMVVVFDQDGKKQDSFKKFIAASEATISSYMYDAYNEEYDRFNFYLANDKDKKLLEKINTNNSNSILVYNATGDLIYHTSGTLSENSELFTPYSYLITYLERANAEIILDKVITNKKASIEELTAAFKNALSIERSYADYESANTPEVISDDATAMAADATDSYDYAMDFKDASNLYKLKASKEMLKMQWSKLVDMYLKNNSYNTDFITLLKKELEKDGFTARIFNETNSGLTDIDFKLLDYAFKHLDEINAEEAKTMQSIEYDYYSSETTINSILEQYVFSYNNISPEYIDDQQILKKTLEYYKLYLDISNPDFTAYYNYLLALETVATNGLNLEYLNTYDTLYKSMADKNMSIIESLDASYSAKYRDQSWIDFKSMFASLANTTAWYIVENDSNNDYLSRAIIWSETSLTLEKTNHYFLDTLAQLYYKNGQKEKAITTEQKAIDLSDDVDIKAQYEVVLEKMKNGTY